MWGCGRVHAKKIFFVEMLQNMSVHKPVVCSGIAKNAKNACAKSLGTVHGVYNEGEPSVGLFV